MVGMFKGLVRRVWNHSRMCGKHPSSSREGNRLHCGSAGGGWSCPVAEFDLMSRQNHRKPPRYPGLHTVIKDGMHPAFKACKESLTHVWGTHR